MALRLEGKKVNVEVDDGVTDFTDVVGGDGPWQRMIFFVIFLGAVPSAWHTFAMTFLAPNTDFWCAKPPEYNNVSTEIWRWYDYSDHCQRYDFPNFTHAAEHGIEIRNFSSFEEANSSLKPCTEWEFDSSVYSRTIVSEWNLVCDKAWTVSMTSSLYMGGSLCSVFLLGQVSDRTGRKPTLIAGVIMFIASGLICSFSTSYLMFAITRFFSALGGDAVYVIGFIILMEAVGVEARSVYGMSMSFGWAMGYVLLPLLAWLIRDWFWIEIAITLPCVGLISMWWLIPESPRWLLTQDRISEAEVILRAAAEKNNREVKNMTAILKKLAAKSKNENNRKQTGTIVDLFRTSGLWQRTLNLVFDWFVLSFIYYGLSFNTNALSGDPFVNCAIAGAVEFPAYFISLFVIRSLGRRIPLMVTMVVGGMSCLVTVFLTEDTEWARVPLAMFGKFCITSSYATLYVYTAEIFPTVVRNTGVGVCSTSARLGSVLAPFVKELGQATHPAVPLAFYGGLSVVSGFLILILPETNRLRVPDTLQEAAEFGKKEKKKELVGHKSCHSNGKELLELINGDLATETDVRNAHY